MRKAVYPGSFDPITNGHVDIIRRAAKLFDEVVVLVGYNKNKKCKFSVGERVDLIIEATKDIPNVKVDSWNGLTMDYVKSVGACAIVRGLRVVSDFEYEWSYSATNEFIDRDVEMVFLMAHKELTFISSSTIDELYHNGVDISPLVPEAVLEAYKSKK